MNRRIVVVPALLAVAVLGAACSSSTSGGGSTASPPPSTTSPTQTASSPGTATSSSSSTSSAPSGGGAGVPSTATLKGIVVQQGDLPSGWIGKPAAAKTAKDKETDTELDTCVGSPISAEQDQIQQLSGDDFSKGQGTVTSDASSYKSETDVQQQVAALKNPKAQPCLNALFRKEIKSSVPASATITAIGIKLDTSHNGGISNLIGVANGSVTLTAQGKTVRIYIGAGFFTGPQLTGEVSFTSIGTPLLSSFANPIVAAVAKRAASA